MGGGRGHLLTRRIWFSSTRVTRSASKGKRFVKKLGRALLVPTLLLALMSDVTTPAYGASSPPLGSATTYALLANTYLNPVPGTTITGDVGFTTAPAFAPFGTHPNYGSAPPYAAAGADQASALALLNAQPCSFTFPAGSIDLATDISHGPVGVYTPGVYCTSGWPVSIGAAGITLNGTSAFIFRTGPISTAANSIVHLTNGASACNTWWTPMEPYPSTLGQSSVFAGTYISSVELDIANFVTWSGRALAFGGTVKTNPQGNITVPTCSIQEPSVLRVVKTVVNNNGSTGVASDFNLHVKLLNVDVPGSPAVGVVSPGKTYFLTNGSTYVVSEDLKSDYTATFSGDCDSNGNVTLGATPKTCTITNTHILTITTCTTVQGGAGPVTTCVTTTPSPTPSPSPSVTPTDTSTPSPSPSSTVSGTPTPSPSPTTSGKPTPSPTPTTTGTPGTPKNPKNIFIPTFPNTGINASLRYANNTTTIGTPVRLIIPSIKVNAVVERIGLTVAKAVDVPKGHGHVGWYELGSKPGNEGTAVIAGHFARKTSGWAVFNELHKLRPGDKLSIQDNSGKTINFVVQSTQVYDLNARPAEVYVSDSGVHLNLITCTGTWINALHGFNKRLVIFTDLVS